MLGAEASPDDLGRAQPAVKLQIAVDVATSTQALGADGAHDPAVQPIPKMGTVSFVWERSDLNRTGTWCCVDTSCASSAEKARRTRPCGLMMRTPSRPPDRAVRCCASLTRSPIKCTTQPRVRQGQARQQGLRPRGHEPQPSLQDGSRDRAGGRCEPVNSKDHEIVVYRRL